MREILGSRGLRNGVCDRRRDRVDSAVSRHDRHRPRRRQHVARNIRRRPSRGAQGRRRHDVDRARGDRRDELGAELGSARASVRDAAPAPAAIRADANDDDACRRGSRPNRRPDPRGRARPYRSAPRDPSRAGMGLGARERRRRPLGPPPLRVRTALCRARRNTQRSGAHPASRSHALASSRRVSPSARTRSRRPCRASSACAISIPTARRSGATTRRPRTCRGDGSDFPGAAMEIATREPIPGWRVGD